jgi:hypothetical protein
MISELAKTDLPDGQIIAWLASESRPLPIARLKRDGFSRIAIAL